MEPARPNPEDLLMRAQAEDPSGHARRGRLKIFFGASPGVGKTFAILQAAQTLRAAGTEVLVGSVETHQRKETEALLNGLEILPRRAVFHRGVTIDEFDLDAAIQRNPPLLLVDELAHTNAPGSRHAKRWQDVMELIDLGVDVLTTLNVQHVESLNDVVARITGVKVKETVPDTVIEAASEMELVDLPVDELLTRMSEGKVYLSGQVERAKESFFRPGNLIALRELALRRTAERVDAQMLAYRRSHSIANSWPVAERILVAIGPGPNAANLTRAASRAAARLNAQWVAVFVETPNYSGYPAETKHRVISAMRLAEELGAETVTLTANKVAQTLVEYARARNVTRLIVGKSLQNSWVRRFKRTLTEELIKLSGAIQVDLIAPVSEDGAVPSPGTSSPVKVSYRELLFAGGVTIAACVICLLLRPVLAVTNLAMVYLLGAVAVSVRCSRRVSTLAAFALVASFDFFCVPPYESFAVSDVEYLITFAAMLTVSLIIASLTANGRGQIAQIASREARTQILYSLSKRLAREEEAFGAATEAARLIQESFSIKTTIFLPAKDGQVHFDRRTSYQLPAPAAEQPIAQWVFDHNQKASKGLPTLNGAAALYFPLPGVNRAQGVMALAPAKADPPLTLEQHNLLDALCQQVGLALERTATQKAIRASELEVEMERMRNSLLSAVSHDLRTPLASITGASTTLLDQSDRLDPATQRDLLTSIYEEAERLGRLVNNLLDMTRLDAGAMVPQRDWQLFEEIAGSAVRRLKKFLAGHPVKISVAGGFPMLHVDAMLMEQVLVNLLENAVRYTPPCTAIAIDARVVGRFAEIEVADGGPGFPAGSEQKVFDKFFRGDDAGGRGSGLGLPICRAIITAHQGVIEAANRHGAVVRIRLPLPPDQPAIPEAPDA